MSVGRFVRYTCNKKNEPVFKEDCKKCPEYNPCAKEGKWCFVGALVAGHDPILNEMAEPIMESAAAPILRDMTTVKVNLGNGMTVDVRKEDILKRLEEDFYKQLNLFYGA